MTFERYINELNNGVKTKRISQIYSELSHGNLDSNFFDTQCISSNIIHIHILTIDLNNTGSRIHNKILKSSPPSWYSWSSVLCGCKSNLLDPVHTGPNPYGHHINLTSFKTSMTLKL